MKILVTGGCGFIGSNLIRFLILEKGESVINYDALTYAANLQALADLERHPDYTFVKGNICDQAALEELFDTHKPDAVLHLAAESHVDRSIEGSDVFLETNVNGTYTLLQVTLDYYQKENKEGFRFIQISTDEVYGSLEPDAPAFTEASPYRPNSPYAASKAAADHLVRAWHSTYGLPTIITCCGNNYGPNQHPEKLIPKVILCCHEQELIPIYGDGFNIRDWIHVEDHTEALYTVLTKGRVGETYNIGGNNERQNIELVRMLCKLMDDAVRQNEDGKHEGVCPEGTTAQGALWAAKEQQRPGKSHESLITFVTDRPGHDLRYAIDASKTRDELGWEPKEDFESGFRKTVQWYLNYPNWWERFLVRRPGTWHRAV
ncbi:MAG: dTDP-glucose 4,6-dehydratase 2 [Opitutia bacterium UBA7350]|nr:MAG: dTDP-glucose 4,6-dehydratase 2 [Opitutae bacterium UBA7350]